MDRETYISWAAELRRRAVEAATAVVGCEEAEDVAQETMLRMWERLDQLDGDRERLLAYAATSARNLAQNRRRQKRRHPLLQLLGWKGDRTDDTPQRRLETTETDSLFAQTMAQLPYNWRTVLQMRNVEDMSFAEIAAVTGMTESSVRGTLSKARRRMIELINRQR
jgi:RNA polymerase sigma-70 factor (ECF subfamily)